MFVFRAIWFLIKVAFFVCGGFVLWILWKMMSSGSPSGGYAQHGASGLTDRQIRDQQRWMEQNQQNLLNERRARYFAAHGRNPDF
jgi:hypothetical protein